MINGHEQLLIDELKRDGILGDLDPSHMKPSIALFCGDCDRSPEALDHRRQMLRAAGIDCKLHHIAVNGGPWNLVQNHFPDLRPESLADPELAGALQALLGQLSGTNRKLVQRILNETVRSFLYKQIRGSEQLKQLGKLELLPHWPCGQGEIGWKMDIEAAFHKSALATYETRDRISTWPETGHIRTASSIHLHKESGMKTYHFRAVRWLETRRAAQLA